MRKHSWKRMTAGVLAMGMLCTAAPAAYAQGLDYFQPQNTYTSGMFTDVPGNSWYAENVATAYELGLMQGSSANHFNPSDNLTVTEMLTMACRIHSIYHTGQAQFEPSTPWYQVYVDYALENNIITAGQFQNYEANATRAQFASVLASAVPAEALTAINTIPDGQIPDVPAGSSGYDAIYLLYRAGILAGNDVYGTFTPNASIERSAVAALVTRIADPDLRQKLSLQSAPAPSASLDFDVYWQNSIQALNVYQFQKDGTVICYDGEPGKAISPSTLHQSGTTRYQINGNQMIFTWSHGGGQTVLELVTPETLKAKGFSILEQVPAGTPFFFETSFVETDTPEQPLYFIPTTVKVQAQAAAAVPTDLRPNDKLTLTGILTETSEIMPNGSTYNAYILKLSQPQKWTLHDDDVTSEETISRIQVSFSQSGLRALLGQEITVTGNVLFAQTAYHLTPVVLLNCTVVR